MFYVEDERKRQNFIYTYIYAVVKIAQIFRMCKGSELHKQLAYYCGNRKAHVGSRLRNSENRLF